MAQPASNDAILRYLDEMNSGIAARFDAVGERFDRMDARLGRVESRFGRVESRLGNVESEMAEFREQQKSVTDTLVDSVADINDRLRAHGI